MLPQNPKSRLAKIMSENDPMTYHTIQEIYNLRYPGTQLTTSEINSLLRDKQFVKVGKMKVSSWSGRKSLHTIYTVVA